MDRGKMPSAGRGAKSKGPQHPQDIFALGSKSTVVVSRDAEKRSSIHKPSTSGGERKREASTFGAPPPGKRSRIGSPAESVTGTSLEVDPVDLVPHVLQALDTHNSDKLLGLLTGSIRLLKSQRSKPDPILCMSMLYLTKIRPNMFAHETVTQSLCGLLKREQGAAFKNKGNPLVFVLACNMLYAGHRDNKNWPDTFIKVYIEDALNERWWVDCSWCKCLVENIVTAFNTKQPPAHLIPTDNTLGTMSPSGSGSPLMGSTDEDADNTELEYSVFPRYSSSYESVEGMVLEAIKEQIQRRAAPDAIGKGFLKLLSATCGFPEIRMISASRLEAWLHSGKLWRAAQELLAHVCCNADASGPTAARDHEVLAQLARMRLKTKPLQAAYVACLREMVSESPALLRSVVTHTIYNELSNVRSPNNMAVLSALVNAQPQLVPQAMADSYLELLLRPEDYLRPLRALTRECVRTTRGDATALVPLARALAVPLPQDPPADIRERAFAAIADLFCLCCMILASHSKYIPDYKQHISTVQHVAVGWLHCAAPVYRPERHTVHTQLNKIMFVEPAESYSKIDNWPPESERAATYRLCTELPLPQNTLLRIIYIGLAKEIPVAPTEVFELIEQLVKRACALPPEDTPLQIDKLEIAEYIFQLGQFYPPENITLPAGYTPPRLAITSLYWRGWVLLLMMAAHNPTSFAEEAARTYPTLRALIDTTITSKPSIEWNNSTQAEAEAERAAILQLETHLAAASNAKLPITEHNCRLLSQLTTLDPLGPARKPPASVLESLQQTSTQLRLGRLLCRQPALLLELVERHGTRRAMPWLHQLLTTQHLDTSVLPVQCLCEFLSCGSSGQLGGGGEAWRAGSLCAHLRRTLTDTAAGARAVLHYYTSRLTHRHAPARAHAHRGLKLVLTQTPEDVDLDINGDVNPEEWLEALWRLPHWEEVKAEVVARIRAACLVECKPRHVAGYISLLQRYVADTPHLTHSDIVLDLSQMLMERMSIMNYVLPTPETASKEVEGPYGPHHTLNAITDIFMHHIQKIRTRSTDAGPEEDAAAIEAAVASSESPSPAWSPGERLELAWPSGWTAHLHALAAHAHLKLLCAGPSLYDTNQEKYNYLLSIWVGPDAPTTVPADNAGLLLPDWLRLHLVRSARAPLLHAGLRQLPAHKLALFIQTFGMPVSSMSALLSALDACPAGAVLRLGVERPYIAQLLRVQRARGARGGHAFANALRLSLPEYPPEDTLFAEEPLPEEMEGAWGAAPAQPSLSTQQVPSVLAAALLDGAPDTNTFTQLLAKIQEEANNSQQKSSRACPYTDATIAFLQQTLGSRGPTLCAGVRAGVLLRALLPHAGGARAPALLQISQALVAQARYAAGPAMGAARALARRAGPAVQRRSAVSLPDNATTQQLITALESATPNTLEKIGNRMIETQDTELVVDAICHILEKNQAGAYEVQIKSEDGGASHHVFSRAGLGCGLLLDWLSELQQETLGQQPMRQMRLMFQSGCASWRPLMATLLAHRASWKTLHTCLTTLLRDDSEWAASSVLDFACTLTTCPRVWQGRDRTTPKHHRPEDMLRTSHRQLCVLVRYILSEAGAAYGAGGEAGAEAMRVRIETRLPLLLQCADAPHRLLSAAPPPRAAATPQAQMLLLLLYMKVPKILQLLSSCGSGGSSRPSLPEDPVLRRAAAASTSATDTVSHSLLCALAHPQPHSKDSKNKTWRLEGGARALWARHGGAGARALPLVAALLRGAPARAPQLTFLLNALEMLPDDALFTQDNSKELGDIIECFMQVGARDSALTHRLAALLRRYLAARPACAAATLRQYRDTVASIPALSGLVAAGGDAAPASAQPPPNALLALQRRENPEELHWPLQEIEAWGTRRGGAWGGRESARAILCASAPLLTSQHAPVRAAALSLLVKLLPACADTTPALQAILSCLDSERTELAQNILGSLGSLVAGMQEHAAAILVRVFALGPPVDAARAKCLETINLLRGC